MRFAFLAAVALLSSPVLAEDNPVSEPKDLTFERVFASPSLNGPTPRQAKLSPDGRYLTLLKNRADDLQRYDLWAYDRETSAWSMLVDSEKLGSGRELSEDEKMQRERARIGSLKGIVSYQWNADGSGLLVPLDGDLYLAKLDGTIQRLTDTEESELNPSLSKTGKYVSFVRDRQLWVGEVGKEAAPITPKEADTIRWGEAEFVAQEEMSRLAGYWWSPDDKRIVVQRTDESRVGVVTRAAIGATGTKVFDQRYPVAGSDNAIVELFVMDPDGGGKVKVDLTSDQYPEYYNPQDPTDFYVARVDWAPDGRLFVQRQNRQQTVLDLLEVDLATGETFPIKSEFSVPEEYWINLSDNYRFLKDGSFIWWSEIDGFGHLYRSFSGMRYQAKEGVDPSKVGTFLPIIPTDKQLTDGSWVVTKLVGVDEETGTVFFTGNKDGVLEQHVYRLDLTKPGEITRLTEPGFTYAASMDEKGQTLLVTRSSDDSPPQTYLADRDGKLLTWIEENALDAEHPYTPFVASHRPTTYGTIKAEDGTDLYWEMITPEMEPGKRYPVFYSHYGGPGPQTVANGWNGALRQAIVDKGYIWFQLDNRGSANRGVAFEQPIYRAMGGVEVRDQKVGAEYLKTLDFVDGDKIAIYGWSYGGYMTLKMLQADPGLYAAGISGAPVTRWELYDTHYTERFMGDPREVPEAYAKASAIPEATKMEDPLLLIHGMADDNVVFENSSELISVLQEANRPFEMMLYPGQTHSVGGEQISPQMWNTMFRFLEANGVMPPE